MDKEILTSEELSELLKVTRGTLNNWRKKGMPYLKGDRAVRFNKSEVMKWINESKK